MRIPNLLEIIEALYSGRKGGHTCSTAFAAAKNLSIVDEYIKGHPQKIERLKNEAEQIRSKPINVLRYETYCQFDTTGSRNDYQDEYFAHRHRLSIMCICAYLFGDEYIGEAENIIWAICDEYTWCLPAHLNGYSLNAIPEHQGAGELNGYIVPYPYNHRNTLDLFACETARELAEMLCLLDGKISSLVRHRAVTEITDRVLNQYITFNDIHHFELSLSNWSAVCAGSLGVAAIYLIESDAQLAPIIQRVISALDVFLTSYGDDGIGREGIGYWNYGFLNLCKFADMLKERTGGCINLFLDEKVGKVASFPSQAFVYKNCCINFSDCKMKQPLPTELASYLLKQYPDMIVPTALFKGEGNTPLSLRSIFWGEISSDAFFRERSDYFEDAGWLVSCKRNQDCCLSFIIKGGTNDEPHNHNDLGHIILYADDEQLLADLGGGEYTKDYFGSKRYNYLVNSSRGHSVPIIEGVYQKEGAESAAEVLNVKTGGGIDRITMELKSGYDVPFLRSFRRQAIIKKEGFSVILKDTYDFNINTLSVTERFVSLYKPVINNGTAYIQGEKHCIAISCENSEPYITEETYIKHSLDTGTAYFVNYDFILGNGETVLFIIEPK